MHADMLVDLPMEISMSGVAMFAKRQSSNFDV